jgi:hypothetical protein
MISRPSGVNGLAGAVQVLIDVSHDLYRDGGQPGWPGDAVFRHCACPTDGCAAGRMERPRPACGSDRRVRSDSAMSHHLSWQLVDITRRVSDG